MLENFDRRLYDIITCRREWVINEKIAPLLASATGVAIVMKPFILLHLQSNPTIHSADKAI